MTLSTPYRTAVVALTIAASVSSVVVVASSSATAARLSSAAARLGAASSPPRVVSNVARVVRVSGQQRLYAERRTHLVRLRVGDKIAQQDLVVLGPSSSATLRLLLTRHSQIRDDTYVLYVARFYTAKPPRSRDLVKQFGLSAFAAKKYRTLRIAPRLLELMP